MALFEQLDHSTQAALLEAGQAATYAADDLLILDGDSSQTLFLIVGGLVKVVKSSVEGRVTFVALRGPGCLVGELSMLAWSPRCASVQAVTQTRVASFSFERFRQLMAEHPGLSMALLADLTDKLNEATDQIHTLAGANAVTRMAGRLVRLAGDASGPASQGSVQLTLPVSQQELGEWAGLSRAATANALSQLRDDGLIETSRMVIAIKDLPRLAAMADG